MTMARSKLTAQGQVSLPAEVRRRLGVGPGSVLEWRQEGREIVVRRAGKYTWEDSRAALFPDGAAQPRTLAQLKQGIRRSVAKRHARD
jgi:antitoxin PrlF